MSIDLSFKSLEVLDASLNLHNYTIINLQGNSFKHEQTYIQQLKVQHLNLSYNNIEHPWLLPATLITLEINNNLITNLANIAHLKNLKQIDLSNNLLSSVHWFNNMSLTHLFLRNNKIKTVETLKVPSLIEIDLECNEIKNKEDLLHLDQMPKLQVCNIYGNPVFDLQVQLKHLKIIEKNCHARQGVNVANSELWKKRNVEEEIQLEVPEPTKKTKSLSPLAKLTKQPQFYDPNKSNKYVTFHDILKNKQTENTNVSANVTTTNTTVVRQSTQSFDQLKQQNKELIQEKFKLQQKLQSSIKQNEIFYQEIEGYKDQLINIVQTLNVQFEDNSSVRQLIDSVEYGIMNLIREQKKQTQECITSTMQRIQQKVKLMNSNLEVVAMKKFVEFTERTKNLETIVSELHDRVLEQKHHIQRLSRIRVSSPILRGSQTSRHSKQGSEIDAAKFKQLFMKSQQQQQQNQLDRPLKTQGNVTQPQMPQVQQFYVDNIQNKIKGLKS